MTGWERPENIRRRADIFSFPIIRTFVLFNKRYNRFVQNRLLLLIVIVSIVLGSSLLTRGHQWGDDFAWYILQAKSISNGAIDEFIETSAFTNTQSTTHVGPLAYPWGYPLILVPAYLIRGIHPLILKLPALFFYAAFLICLYAWMKSRVSQHESLLVVAVFAFNPLLLGFLDQILSDIPFLFFSTLALYLMTRQGKRTPILCVAIGASIFFTAFLRATGILLLGCFLIVEFFRLVGNRKERGTAKEIVIGGSTVTVTFAVLWIVNLLSFPSGEQSYASQYAGSSVAQIGSFIVSYFNVFSTFFGDAHGWLYLYYVLAAFFLTGLWLRWRQEPVVVLFFSLWMIVHITYPYWQGARYIFPVLPIFIYFTFVGMKSIAAKISAANPRLGQWGFHGFWSLIAVIFLLNSGVAAYNNLQHDRDINGPFDSYSKEVYKYIQEETPEDSVVVFFKPRVMKLMTDRDSIMSTECDRILKGDYLVLSRKVGENQQIPPERIDSCNLHLIRVLNNNRFVVYEIQK